ncbi:hypothetical protein ACTQ56_01590 [[Clostridium] aminophilum]|nr:hypothetical protein [[Clostridium] aminophilum]
MTTVGITKKPQTERNLTADADKRPEIISMSLQGGGGRKYGMGFENL